MSNEIKWTGDNIMEVWAFMAPVKPIHMGAMFSDADKIIGVITPAGLNVARIGDWIVKGNDGISFYIRAEPKPGSNVRYEDKDKPEGWAPKRMRGRHIDVACAECTKVIVETLRRKGTITHTPFAFQPDFSDLKVSHPGPACGTYKTDITADETREFIREEASRGPCNDLLPANVCKHGADVQFTCGENLNTTPPKIDGNIGMAVFSMHRQYGDSVKVCLYCRCLYVEVGG